MSEDWREGEAEPYVDYYATLGVTFDASIDEIRSAYRKIIRDYHPDSTGRKETDEDKIKIASAQKAYDTLRDESARATFDRKWQAKNTSGVKQIGGPSGQESPEEPIHEDGFSYTRDSEGSGEAFGKFNFTSDQEEVTYEQLHTKPINAEDVLLNPQVLKSLQEKHGGFWGQKGGKKNELGLGGNPLSSEQNKVRATIKKETDGRYRLTGAAVNKSFEMDSYDKIEEEDGVFIAKRGTTRQILSPATGERLSEIYEHIVPYEGALVGIRFGKQYLLSSITGKEISEGFERLNWIFATDNGRRDKIFLVGTLRGKKCVIDPKTGTRSPLYDSIERRQKERITVGTIMGREFLLNPHTGEKTGKDFEKIGRDKFGRIVGKESGRDDVVLGPDTGEKKPNKKKGH